MISLALTNYNRTDLLLRSFSACLDDPRVSEIVIVDDCSEEKVYRFLELYSMTIPKIKLFRNEKNLGVYFNKKRSVELCTNDFVIVGDSDNFYDRSFVDKIYEYDWHEDAIFAPDFAKPHFSYQAFSGMTIDKTNVAKYMELPMFSTMLNTFNFFINRKSYLEVFDDSIEPVTFDSLYFNYCWLKHGKKFHVVKGLQYDHMVHEGSHFQNNVHLSGDLMQEIETKLKELR
jgi:glycosyltransferase involved in cell wall biosynthesis